MWDVVRSEVVLKYLSSILILMAIAVGGILAFVGIILHPQNGGLFSHGASTAALRWRELVLIAAMAVFALALLVMLLYYAAKEKRR